MKQLFASGAAVVVAVIVIILFMTTGYTKVRLGYEVGLIPVMGSDKGGAEQVKILSKGRHWFPKWKYDVVENPTFFKEYVWTASPAEGSKDNEAISFQDKAKMKYTADVGIKFKMLKGKTGYLWADLHKDVDDIIDTNLYNSVRKKIGIVSSTRDPDEIIGKGRKSFGDRITELVRKEWEDYFEVVDVFFIGPIDPPRAVKTAIENAVKKNEEIKTATSERLKKQQETDAITYAITQTAIAEADAIKIVRKQITPEYTAYLEIMKWNGSRATTIVPAMVMQSK